MYVITTSDMREMLTALAFL